MDQAVWGVALDAKVPPLALGVVDEARGFVTGCVDILRRNYRSDDTVRIPSLEVLNPLCKDDWFLEIAAVCEGIILVQSEVRPYLVSVDDRRHCRRFVCTRS